MSKKDYRLPAYPKKTIREKQGSHGDLSISKVDYTLRERAIYASQVAKKNALIKEKMDAWKHRSCNDRKCSAVIEVKRNRPITCRKVGQCSWAEYQGIS